MAANRQQPVSGLSLDDPGSDVAVLILAGGEARRMGGAKPLRMLGGRTLLDRAIGHAERWSDRIAIAARSVDQVGAARYPIMIDPPEFEGPLAGLASASRLNRPLVLTIPCDMPFLPGDLVERLAQSIGERGAALAASGGRPHPVCGMWRTEALAALHGYHASGRRSLMGLAEAVGYAAVEWAEDGAFANVNTPAELRAAQARLA